MNKQDDMDIRMRNGSRIRVTEPKTEAERIVGGPSAVDMARQAAIAAAERAALECGLRWARASEGGEPSADTSYSGTMTRDLALSFRNLARLRAEAVKP